MLYNHQPKIWFIYHKLPEIYSIPHPNNAWSLGQLWSLITFFLICRSLDGWYHFPKSVCEDRGQNAVVHVGLAQGQEPCRAGYPPTEKEKCDSCWLRSLHGWWLSYLLQLQASFAFIGLVSLQLIWDLVKLALDWLLVEVFSFSTCVQYRGCSKCLWRI